MCHSVPFILRSESPLRSRWSPRHNGLTKTQVVLPKTFSCRLSMVLPICDLAPKTGGPMRAVIYRKSGPAGQVLQVVDLPEPAPGPGQVSVRLAYSGVNPTDWKRRLNEAPRFGEFQIPHHDGAGLIDQVGPGVDPGRRGERVWVYHGAVGQPFGTAAEVVCVGDTQAVPLPPHVPLLQGATIGIPYMTAAHALSFAPGDTSTTVLVQGGAGAVGFAVLQLARARGMTVVTTVSNEEKASIARAAHPDAILNYRAPEFAKQLREVAPAGLELVTEVDLDRNLATYVDQLQAGAHVVAYASNGFAENVPVRALMFRNANLHFFVVYLLPDSQIESAVAAVRGLLDSGNLPSLPIHEYGVHEVAQAHDDVQAGLVGRAVIRLS